MTPPQFAAPVLVIAAPLLAACLLPVIGWWRRGAVVPTALAALAAAAGLAAITAATVASSGPVEYFLGGWAPPWGIAFRVDALGALLLLLVTWVALLVGVYATRSAAVELAGREAPFYSLYLLLVTGLAGLVSTADLFNLYVFLEISSLASYALVASGGGAAVVSAFRYVILGTIGAAFYLLAVGYLYSAAGTLNMADLARILPDLYGSPTVRVGFAFVVVGMALKMALFPLHAWLPGAYAHAPSAVSALVAATTTKVAAYVLIRIVFFVFEPRFAVEILPAAALLGWAGAAAMVAGSVLAIAQTDLKRMLAWSSVAQIGYIALGIGLANTAGFTGSVLHVVNHAVMKGGLFLAAGAFAYRTGARAIRDLDGLGLAMPWTAGAFVLAALAMVGLPPAGAFFSKLYLILGAIDAGQWPFVAIILFSSVLALAYFGNVIRRLYFLPLAAAGRAGGAADAVTSGGATGAVMSGGATDAVTRGGAAGAATREGAARAEAGAGAGGRRSDAARDAVTPGAGAGAAVGEAPPALLAPILILAAAIVVLGLGNGVIVARFIDPARPAFLP